MPIDFDAYNVLYNIGTFKLNQNTQWKQQLWQHKVDQRDSDNFTFMS